MPRRDRQRSLALAARRWLAAALLALVPALARPEPSFQFEKRGDARDVRWSGALRAGACLSGGNTSSAGLSAEGSISRTSLHHRLLLGGSAAYARSKVAVPLDADGQPGIGPGELRAVDRTTKRNWAARVRYDRFLSAHGSAYLLAAAGADEPAGKRLVLAGQIGYGMDLLHDPAHTMRLEVGYDLSREDHVTSAPRLEIHSARLFAGWSGALSAPVAVETSVELLTNLNPEQGAPRVVKPFQDTRLNARLALKVKLNGTLSTGLQLGAAYDRAPAPRPPPPGSSWAPGHQPLAERLDTTAEWFVGARF